MYKDARYKVQGFRVTGIMPFDRNIFTDADFIAAETEALKTCSTPNFTSQPSPSAQHGLCQNLEQQTKANNPGTESQSPTSNSGPVSYTHLDVYKRQ